MADSTESRALLLQINATTELLRSQLSDAEKATADFQRATQGHLDKVDQRFDLLGKGIEKLEGPLERIKALGEVAIGAVLGESLLEAGKKGLEFAGNIKFVSEQLGVSTQFLQQYRYAAGQFGVGTEEADTAITKFTRSVGEAANGNKSLIDVFNRLHVNIFDANGALRSTQAVFLDVANGIKQFDTPAQRTADTMTLLGRGAAGLTPLLASGASGFNDLAAAAQQLGIVLGPDLIDHSEEVNHKLAALKQIVDAQFASAVAQNAAAIETFASAMVAAAGGISRFLASNPQAALALLGSAAGFLKGGPIGSLIGGGIGAIAGNYLSNKSADDTGDFAKRQAAFQDAAKRLYADQHTDKGKDFGSGLISIHHAGEASAADIPAAQAEFNRQRALYATAYTQFKRQPVSEGLGSNLPGVTNNSGKDLRDAQAKLSSLEALRGKASGSALTAINEEIAQQKRRISFIKQGADAEEAGSLASKEGAADKKGESDAAKAARKLEEQRKQALAADLAYTEEELKLRRSILEGAKSSSANDAKRDQLQRDIINDEADSEKARIAEQLRKVTGDPDVSADQRALATKRAGNLDDLNEQNRAQGLANVDIARLAQTQKELADKAALDLQGQIDLTSLDDRLALTRQERLKYELQLLAYQEQQAKAAQQAIIDSKDPKVTQAQRDDAAARIGQIDAQHGRNVDIVQRQNASPIQQYHDQLSSAVGDVHDDLQSLEVSAIGHIGDSFEQAATKALHLHGILGDIAGDFIKLAAQELELKLVDSLFHTGSDGGGGFISSISKLFGGGKAVGGSVDASKFYLVGEKGPELFAPGQSGAIIPNRAIVPAYVPSASRIGQQRQQAAQVAIHVVAGEYFDARVSGIATGHISDAAPAIASSGAQQGFQMAREHSARAARYNYNQD